MLAVETTAVVAATIMALGVLIPQALRDGGVYNRRAEGQELASIVLTILGSAVVLAVFGHASAAALLLAVGIWALAVGYTALHMDRPPWWLWQWRRQHRLDQKRLQELGQILDSLKDLKEAMSERQERLPGDDE